MSIFLDRIIQVLKICVYLFLKRSKVKTNRIYFNNLWGKYNDNTKALAEAYHKAHPDYELVYQITEKSDLKEFPSFLTLVKKGTFKADIMKYSSAVVIDNDWGDYKKDFRGKSGFFLRVLCKLCISKKCYYASTGHGTPIKRLGLDIKDNDYDYFVTSTRTMFVPDRHLIEVSNRICLGEIQEYIISGSPRNDCLYFNNEEKSKKKVELGLPDKNIAVIAPTFRTINVDGCKTFVQANNIIDDICDKSSEIINELKLKFGGEWIIALRIHPGLSTTIKKLSTGMVLADKSSDMADYLMVADFLATDYSSCVFDFLLTGRPSALIWNDVKDYSDNQRGLYFKKDELPVPICYSVCEFINIVKTFDYSRYIERVGAFCEKWEFSNNKDSCKFIIDYLDNKVNNETK